MPKKTKQTKVPRPANLRGRGDYSEDIKAIAKFDKRIEAKIDHLERTLLKTPKISNIAASAGRALGSRVGLGDLGAQAGSGLASLFGMGDYSLKGNSLIKGEVHGPVVPTFGSESRAIRVREREYIGNVFSGTLSGSATVFTNTPYVINPADATTFPWLSNIAPLFDQWIPHGIVFEYITTSSEYNGTSQALGKVVLATDYDSTDALYSSSQQAENSDYAVITKPSESVLHGVECDPSERPMRCMYTTTSATTSPLFSSLGNFQICTQGCNTAGVLLGELWVSYDISFLKKNLVPVGSLGNHICVVGLSINGGAVYPNSNIVTTDNSIVLSQIVGTGSRFSFPVNQSSGKYLATLFFDVTNAATIPFATLFNCTIVSVATGVAPANTGRVVLITITGPGAYFQTNVAASATQSNIEITSVSPDFVVN